MRGLLHLGLTPGLLGESFNDTCYSRVCSEKRVKDLSTRIAKAERDLRQLGDAGGKHLKCDKLQAQVARLSNSTKLLDSVDCKFQMSIMSSMFRAFLNVQGSFADISLIIFKARMNNLMKTE